MPKIKVNVRPKVKIPSKQELDHPAILVNKLGINGLIMLCQQNEVIIRGGPHNICRTLKKKLYLDAICKSPNQVIARTFIRYLFWHLGRCQWTDSSCNEVDFYTSVPIHLIPECYRFLCRSHSQIHGFDIRSLVYYQENGNNFRHPYTDRLFTQEELQRMNAKLRWLYRLGYLTNIPQKAIPVQSRRNIEQVTVNVFSSINEHQYVDYHWYMDLNHHSLVQLYYELHEIWTYRLPMQSSHKEQITKYPICANWINIKNYQPSMENKLRIEILQNIKHLVEDGITEDHRKTGCYIFMLGLVLVSEHAATSHPSLYQAACYDP